MRKIIATLIIILLNNTNVLGQKIEVGQDAIQIKSLIEMITQQHNRYDSYGNRANSTASYDVKYNNGVISDVIQCFDNQYLSDFSVVASFCKHFIMKNGKLEYTINQYKNISTSTLIGFYNKIYEDKKIGDYYFSNDFEYYSKIYLAKNKLATVEWRKTEPKMLSLEIQKKLKIEQNTEKERLRVEEEEKIKEQEIKSKTYDLKENNVSLYNENYNEIISKILDYLQELPISSRYSRASKPYDYYGDTNIPTFRILAKSKENKYRFKNTYTAYYILKDNSRPSENLGSMIVAGSYDVNQKGKITLDSGTDNSCSLFNHISFRIPTIKVQEYEVMTEATFPNISVDYAKGITIIKIKSDEINFVDFAPDDDIQNKLKEKLKNEIVGKYVVKYEVGNIAGKEFVNIEIVK